MQRSNELGSVEVVYTPTDSIRPNSYNPNRQSADEFELLLKSIATDGFTQPVIVQRETNQIVDGEHRWRAAQKLEIGSIPVVFVDMTPEQMRVATLRHNRARGSEQIDLTSLLIREIESMNAIEWAQDELMMSDDELALLLDKPIELPR